MCGIVGMFSFNDVNQSIYNGLIMLQHRGQDAAGISTLDGRHFNTHRGTGLVDLVFHNEKHMYRLKGNMGIGHVRYPTTGSNKNIETQPFYVNSPYGINLCHNGNLINTVDLKEQLFTSGLKHTNSDSDSEVLLNVFADELQQNSSTRLSKKSIFKAIKGIHNRCVGSYAVISLVAGFGLVAFTDPFGIRPLVVGEKTIRGKKEYMVASESVALESSGFKISKYLGAGEAVTIDKAGQITFKKCHTHTQLTPCIFEYIYLARPDSTLHNVSVNRVRINLGRYLASRIKEQWSSELINDIDLIVPIPDSSRVAAFSLAQTLKIEYNEAIVKNRYISRTFIMPNQRKREQSVRRKLNPIESELRGKNVLLIDDSIVRGTTAKSIIKEVKRAGAKKIYFASAAPELKHINVYGIDLPMKNELFAMDKTLEEMRIELGLDALIFQKLSDCKEAIFNENHKISDLECSVFDGIYITGELPSYYLDAQKERT